eukprot:TRINITY_DN7593_c0_g1_i1.p1 TRINITY_DN7593_c0_g1~~TRINITY_DN7593_c0_g1_i1.p1  ORF type:complete len:697 (+),score=188.12 TRINITY_DN7593_c0_g1_i1:3277-5367(+)
MQRKHSSTRMLHAVVASLICSCMSCNHTGRVMDTVETIKKLPQDVVNKIAAGEVVQRPCHAVKELIENSLDAHATQITVIAKNGGTKLVVTDNGDGIRPEDMKRVCERFTTSKLTKYEDLQHVATFGFRGEALASITYVARVRIVTRRKGASKGVSASYLNGEMKEAAPNVTVCPEGTSVTVDDLFYNLPVRKASLRSSGTEYSRILEVVKRYAVNYPETKFLCRKDFTAQPDLNTVGTEGTPQGVIPAVFGKELDKHLHEINLSTEDITVKGLFTGTDYTARRIVSMYFVNGRLVDCSPIQKAVAQAYVPFLGKGKHPFVYLSITVPPDEIDVNVHPTKAEVALLKEDTIASKVHDAITAKLNTIQQISKEFPVVVLKEEARKRKLEEDEKEDSGGGPRSPSPSQGERDLMVDSVIMKAGKIELKVDSVKSEKANPFKQLLPTQNPPKHGRALAMERIAGTVHKRMKEIFENMEHVGMVGERACVFRSGDDIYLMDLRVVMREAAYQRIVRGECSSTLTFSEPPRIADLCEVALGIPGVWEPSDGDKQEIRTALVDCLVKHRPVLQEVGIVITTEGKVTSLPRVWNGFVPSLEHLPLALLRIGSDVPWEAGDTSELVYRTLATELSSLYTPIGSTCDPAPPDPSSPMSTFYPASILPSLKGTFMPPTQLTKGTSLVKLTNISALHTTFERSHCTI